MADVNSTSSIVVLNANELNTPVRAQQKGFLKIFLKIQLYAVCLCERDTLDSMNEEVKSRRMEKDGATDKRTAYRGRQVNPLRRHDHYKRV